MERIKRWYEVQFSINAGEMKRFITVTHFDIKFDYKEFMRAIFSAINTRDPYVPGTSLTFDVVELPGATTKEEAIGIAKTLSDSPAA